MTRHTLNGPQVGLTLVELVVVLAILVLAAGTALTATGSLADQSRYENTQNGLDSLERALLGRFDSASNGGADAISFVADVGRLPRVTNTDPALGVGLAEVWIHPAGVAQFEILPARADPDVVLPVGWRGPYVRLGFGTAKLVDGWGRPYVLFGLDGVPAMAGSDVGVIRTLGADGAPGGSGFDADTEVALMSPTQSARHLGAVPVRVRTTSETEIPVCVRLYGAREGATVFVEVADTVRPRKWQGVTLQVSGAAKAGKDFQHTFTGVTVGPHAVRAYMAAPQNEDTAYSSEERSPIRAITVVQGGIPEVELELP